MQLSNSLYVFIQGIWSDWSSEDTCDVVCGGNGGTRTRTRVCLSGESQCSGMTSQTEHCLNDDPLIGNIRPQFGNKSHRFAADKEDHGEIGRKARDLLLVIICLKKKKCVEVSDG